LQRAARRRWAELLRRVYEVDPPGCPRCGGEIRIVSFIQTPEVIDRILRHLREKGRDARAGPWAEGSGTDRSALETDES